MTNLKDAKQLLIQQKLELQGKVDNVNLALEQEKKNQQIIKDQLKKKEEELKKECVAIETKLVSMYRTCVYLAHVSDSLQRGWEADLILISWHLHF